jgi:hypothetical protein
MERTIHDPQHHPKGAKTMFTVTRGLRTIVSVGAVGATLASSGVASAARAIHQPGAATAVVASQPTTVAQYIDPSKTFSAGIAGYSDAKCEQLAQLHNSLAARARAQAGAGNMSAAGEAYHAAEQAADELGSNCGIMD